MASLPTTQRTIATPGKRQRLIQVTRPVDAPNAGEVVIHIKWVASTPLDLHRADGGVLVAEWPHVLGGGGATGVIAAVSSQGETNGLKLGDRVMTFAWRGEREANLQEYITVPAYLVSKVPEGMKFEEAATINTNAVTVFNTVTADLGLEMPWPIPQGWKPTAAGEPILIWGASSSVGIFAVQILKRYGYTNILAVSSAKHHTHLKELGAAATLDYTKDDVVDEINGYASNIPYIIDCIGSLEGTLQPLVKIAKSGSRVAIMLPVIVNHASEQDEPEYEMDVANLGLSWADGVILQGVRTHFYLNNELWKEKLQPEIIPALLKEGSIRPNNYRVVEGATAVERAQNALDLLRNRAVSGERLVWRIFGDD